MKRKLYLLITMIVAGYLWYRLQQEERASTARTERRAEPVRTRQTSSGRAKDALTEIEGIGPAFEKALNEIGIYSFDQLAEQEADDLASRLPARITAERIRRDRWIEQARTRSQS